MNKNISTRTVLITLLILVLILFAGACVIYGPELIKYQKYNYPELPDNPRAGKWYKVNPEGAMDATGDQWTGLFKLGTENKVIVYFFGGGMSFDEVTSHFEENFYTSETSVIDCMTVAGGITSSDKANPFRDWTYLVLPYSTGDFQIGNRSFTYENENSEELTVYHNGYNNFKSYMDIVRKYAGEPDTLLITGYSAGAVSTALLADEVIDMFPSADNVTVACDSFMILYDGWQMVASDVWGADSKFTDYMVSDNIVLDALEDLYAKRGDSIKILFDCSTRDAVLQQYQSYIYLGKITQDRQTGDQFEEDLSQMVADLQEKIPGIGIYIWEFNPDPETGNTVHTMLTTSFYEYMNDGETVIYWIYDAVNGNVKTYGLELFNQ